MRNAGTQKRKRLPVGRKRKPTAILDAEIDDVLRQFAETAPVAQPLAASQSPLHELFNRQVRDILDNAGLAEDEKQSILVAMACPCCGGGAASFTYKLKSDR